MDLFESQGVDAVGVPTAAAHSPLAVRMRPTTIADVVGQEHLLAPGMPLWRLLQEQDQAGPSVASVVLWGPPGTGKTTLAYLVARASKRRFVELSAVSAGVKEVREVVAAARRRLATSGEETVLFVDEVHRFSKSQQDALLPSVENRWVTLVAATTENPSFSVIAPLLSRSLLLTLQPLGTEALTTLLQRAVTAEEGLREAITLPAEVAEAITRLAGGDARRSLTLLEAAAGATLQRCPGVPRPTLELADLEAVIDAAVVRYDRDGDMHYDITSAFIKSMRGSDVDAALHYLARMLVAGEDPRFIARRIVIAASEEVGMADPGALQVAVAAFHAVSFLGMPEGRIPLAQAVVHIATAPKSNRAYLAIDKAIADVRAGRTGPVPLPLRDGHYAGAKDLGHGVGYVYAHDAPHAIAPQVYAPAAVRGQRYYEPSERGYERTVAPRLARIRDILAGGTAHGDTEADGQP
ncbi:replication-associated recombination protein A [Buchananella hordeovulneris]|uniref:AAA family ATPase n=1 Tax=Buchananella hordeovulneris TaxID=52770 RepID=A0A1Q5PY26_9ACTO|nr:replication-associated recombination protein A [Buchananella hordeovulneris]OKL52437.1 AAA family ATPase [Buchananella hordeovulneris]